MRERRVSANMSLLIAGLCGGDFDSFSCAHRSLLGISSRETTRRCEFDCISRCPRALPTHPSNRFTTAISKIGLPFRTPLPHGKRRKYITLNTEKQVIFTKKSRATSEFRSIRLLDAIVDTKIRTHERGVGS